MRTPIAGGVASLAVQLVTVTGNGAYLAEPAKFRATEVMVFAIAAAVEVSRGSMRHEHAVSHCLMTVAYNLKRRAGAIDPFIGADFLSYFLAIEVL